MDRPTASTAATAGSVRRKSGPANPALHGDRSAYFNLDVLKDFENAGSEDDEDEAGDGDDGEVYEDEGDGDDGDDGSAHSVANAKPPVLPPAIPGRHERQLQVELERTVRDEREEVFPEHLAVVGIKTEELSPGKGEKVGVSSGVISKTKKKKKWDEKGESDGKDKKGGKGGGGGSLGEKVATSDTGALARAGGSSKYAAPSGSGGLELVASGEARGMDIFRVPGQAAGDGYAGRNDRSDLRDQTGKILSREESPQVLYYGRDGVREERAGGTGKSRRSPIHGGHGSRDSTIKPTADAGEAQTTKHAAPQTNEHEVIETIEGDPYDHQAHENANNDHDGNDSGGLGNRPNEPGAFGPGPNSLTPDSSRKRKSNDPDCRGLAKRVRYLEHDCPWSKIWERVRRLERLTDNDDWSSDESFDDGFEGAGGGSAGSDRAGRGNGHGSGNRTVVDEHGTLVRRPGGAHGQRRADGGGAPPPQGEPTRAKDQQQQVQAQARARSQPQPPQSQPLPREPTLQEAREACAARLLAESDADDPTHPWLVIEPLLSLTDLARRASDLRPAEHVAKRHQELKNLLDAFTPEVKRQAFLDEAVRRYRPSSSSPSRRQRSGGSGAIARAPATRASRFSSTAPTTSRAPRADAPTTLHDLSVRIATLTEAQQQEVLKRGKAFHNSTAEERRRFEWSRNEAVNTAVESALDVVSRMVSSDGATAWEQIAQAVAQVQQEQHALLQQPFPAPAVGGGLARDATLPPRKTKPPATAQAASSSPPVPVLESSLPEDAEAVARQQSAIDVHEILCHFKPSHRRIITDRVRTEIEFGGDYRTALTEADYGDALMRTVVEILKALEGLTSAVDSRLAFEEGLRSSRREHPSSSPREGGGSGAWSSPVSGEGGVQRSSSGARPSIQARREEGGLRASPAPSSSAWQQASAVARSGPHTSPAVPPSNFGSSLPLPAASPPPGGYTAETRRAHALVQVQEYFMQQELGARRTTFRLVQERSAPSFEEDPDITVYDDDLPYEFVAIMTTLDGLPNVEERGEVLKEAFRMAGEASGAENEGKAALMEAAGSGDEEAAAKEPERASTEENDSPITAIGPQETRHTPSPATKDPSTARAEDPSTQPASSTASQQPKARAAPSEAEGAEPAPEPAPEPDAQPEPEASPTKPKPKRKPASKPQQSPCKKQKVSKTMTKAQAEDADEDEDERQNENKNKNKNEEEDEVADEEVSDHADVGAGALTKPPSLPPPSLPLFSPRRTRSMSPVKKRGK
ncbi:hypothetical protein MBLNU230_g6227t1 [Neophaeotheca triangularis]